MTTDPILDAMNAASPISRRLDEWDATGLSRWFVIVFAIGSMMFFYHWLGPLAAGRDQSPIEPLINEMTGAFASGLLVFPLAWLIERKPIAPTLPRAGMYAAVVAIFAALHTTMMWGSREIVYRIAGLGDYDYGKMPLRYFMELPFQLIGLTLIITILHGMRHLRLSRERDIRTANLEASLAGAQLQNLRLQLQPHFLFNALNTISSTMYEDPAAADEMLDRLAELLRVSLRTARSDEVTLSTELATLHCYLDLMKARFGERLDVRFDVDPGLSESLVPSMILQPLVENAVRHGNAETNGRGRITIRVREDGPGMAIEVEDDGPGADPETISEGVGLTTTAERLRLLYGDDQSFSVSRIDDGFIVRLRIPGRREVTS